MESFFFTCGQTHRHETKGAIWDKDSVLQVNARDEDEARYVVFDIFGPKWSMCYTRETISMEYYPNGICHVIEITQ